MNFMKYFEIFSCNYKNQKTEKFNYLQVYNEIPESKQKKIITIKSDDQIKTARERMEWNVSRIPQVPSTYTGYTGGNNIAVVNNITSCI